MRPPRYEEAARKLIAEVGLNREIGMSADELAIAIDMPASATARVLKLMTRVGTATLRETWNGTGGKKAFYTLLAGYEETDRRLKEQGIPWSAFAEANSSPKEVKARQKSPDTYRIPDSPFAGLAQLKKSDPRAELEVARRYRDQQAFITAKTKEFADMGLVFDPAAIKIDYDDARRRELEAIARVLPYVESVEKSNTNLEEQNRSIRIPQAELMNLRSEVRNQRDQIERLVREKGDIKDDVQRMLGDHKREVQGYKEEIDTLKADLRRIRGDQAVNGAVMRHEVNEAITKMG